MGGGYLTQPFYHMAPRQTMPYSTSDFGFNAAGSIVVSVRISSVIENQDAAVFQVDFLGLPCWTLIEAIGVGIRWIP
jgi:hypothetical protein